MGNYLLRMLLACSSVFWIVSSCAAEDQPKHHGRKGAEIEDFSLAYSLIPIGEIRDGGPGKDGIPALTNPTVIKRAKQASYLRPRDTVIGVEINKQTRAYPLRILTRHENVNDTLGGKPIAVTYCPLCDSSFVFERNIGGQVREFGISGLLWNSNVLLFDRQKRPANESLWSQVQMRAVTGPAAQAGLKLKLLPAFVGAWEDWRRAHPKTTVLSVKTGYRRNYRSKGYEQYFSNDRLMFRVRPLRQKPAGFANKEKLVMVQAGGALKAYALKDLASATDGIVEDRIGDAGIRLEYSKKSGSVRVTYTDANSGSGQPPTAYLFWFALGAILPQAELYGEPAAESDAGVQKASGSQDTAVVAPASLRWESWGQAALERAQRERKLILVDVYADWCGPCKLMDSTTYRDQKVLEKLRGFVTVKINIDEDAEAAAKFTSGSIPTTAILSPSGRLLKQKIGYIKPGEFLTFLNTFKRQAKLPLPGRAGSQANGRMDTMPSIKLVFIVGFGVVALLVIGWLLAVKFRRSHARKM